MSRVLWHLKNAGIKRLFSRLRGSKGLRAEKPRYKAIIGELIGLTAALAFNIEKHHKVYSERVFSGGAFHVSRHHHCLLSFINRITFLITRLQGNGLIIRRFINFTLSSDRILHSLLWITKVAFVHFPLTGCCIILLFVCAYDK